MNTCISIRERLVELGPLISVKDLAAITGISHRTIWKWISGETQHPIGMPPALKIGHARRFRASDIADWLDPLSPPASQGQSTPLRKPGRPRQGDR